MIGITLAVVAIITIIEVIVEVTRGQGVGLGALVGIAIMGAIINIVIIKVVGIIEAGAGAGVIQEVIGTIREKETIKKEEVQVGVIVMMTIEMWK